MVCYAPTPALTLGHALARIILGDEEMTLVRHGRVIDLG